MGGGRHALVVVQLLPLLLYMEEERSSLPAAEQRAERMHGEAAATRLDPDEQLVRQQQQLTRKVRLV